MDFLKTALPYIIIVLVVALIIGWGVWFARKVNGPQQQAADAELEERRKNVKAARVNSFIHQRIMPFYEVLRAALPKNYIILPNVALELLFKPEQRKDLRLGGQYCDFCVFTEKFAPSLVINLSDYSLEWGDEMFRINNKIKDVIKSSGIAVMDYTIRDVYSVDDIRRSVAAAMNPLLK